MRVLQVLPTLSAGGAEGFVTNLGVSLVQHGVKVRFFLLAGARGERGQVLHSRLREARIEVYGTEEHNVRSPMNIIHLAGLIRSWRPDIVQANMYTAEVLVAIARVLSVGSGAHYVRRLANTKQSGYRSTIVVRMMDRFYRQTIACSTAVTQAYIDFMGAEYKSELITILNGGHLREANTSSEDKKQSREILGISSRTFMVAHIGRMFPGGRKLDGGLETSQKAHDILIRAFKKAFPSAPDCMLAMVGDGPLRIQLEKLVKDLGIAEQTRFLGQQPEPWLVLKAADMFCFPSRYEGLPNVLPEAASCGLPVVASDIREIHALYPGDAWLLKPVDDVEAFAEGLRAVRANLEQFACRARDAADGFRKQFSMNTCAGKYLQVYESVLGWNTKNRD